MEEHMDEDRYQSCEVMVGRFRLIDYLSSGAMGDVWEAEDPSTGEKVALKCPRDEASAKHLLEEAQVLQDLKDADSPHLLRWVEGGWHPLDAEGTTLIPWFATELLRGMTLRDYVRTNGPLSPEEAIGIALQVADGLLAAHRRWILHRDLKPQNIFLHFLDDGAMIAKVIDFGIAGRVNQPSTKTGENGATLTFGTPRYMSPQQLRLESLDATVDVYALGLVILFMLFGHHFRTDDCSPRELFPHMLQQCEEEYVWQQISSLKLPFRLSQTLFQMMRRESADRLVLEEVVEGLRTALCQSTAAPPVVEDHSELRLTSTMGVGLLLLTLLLSAGGGWLTAHYLRPQMEAAESAPSRRAIQTPPPQPSTEEPRTISKPPASREQMAIEGDGVKPRPGRRVRQHHEPRHRHAPSRHHRRRHRRDAPF